MSTSTKRGGRAGDGAAAVTWADEGETLVVQGRVVAKAGPAASSWRRSRCARTPALDRTSSGPHRLRPAQSPAGGARRLMPATRVGPAAPPGAR